jgi:hypothetical protein
VCTPHKALLDLIGDTLRPAWRQRLFEMLVTAGFTTPEQVEAASDAELRAIDQLGPSSLAFLRDRLAARPTRAERRRPSAAERLAAGIKTELRRHGGGSALP